MKLVGLDIPEIAIMLLVLLVVIGISVAVVLIVVAAVKNRKTDTNGQSDPRR